MIKGKTESGFAFEIDEAAFDDYEILDALVAVDRGETVKIIDVIDRLLGEAQKETLKEFLRGENGRVSSAAMVEAVSEIIGACKEGKNS